MNLILRRRPSNDKCTIGELYRDGNMISYTLEDVVRDVKIFGETAIPQGRYKITITYSKHFDRYLPLLNDVPGYEGVRIHPGNTDKDTEGCVLPGMSIGPDGNSILESRFAFNKIYKVIEDSLNAKEEVWLEIRNA